MSYPGYPPYPGQGGQPPYPPQGAPYPTQQGGVFPPSLGFNVNAPMYMPQPGYPPPHHHQRPPFGGHAVFPPGAYPPGAYPPGTYPGDPPQSFPSHHQSFPSRPQSYPSAPHTFPSDEPLTFPHEHTETDDAETYPYEPPIISRPFPTYTPTLFPVDPFDATADAEILRKAMKGFGTDEEAIIGVLAHRTNEQRMEIAVRFKTMYGKNLIKDLKSESSGNFKKLLVAMVTPLPQFYAKNLHDAMRGFGTDEDVLIEVLCTKTNSEIQTIRAAYEAEYGSCLEDDLISDTSGTFKRVMVSMSTAARDESMETNVDEAREDAQRLMDAGVLKWGTDESTFNMILCQRNFAQLQLIFEEYEALSGQKMEDTIRSEFSGNSEDAFLAIARVVRSRPLFFAKCIRDAIAGLGTKDKKLIRLCVTRCEIDMVDIKEIYAERYGESLADAISGDTSGDYRRCLLALVGE